MTRPLLPLALTLACVVGLCAPEIAGAVEEPEKYALAEASVELSTTQAGAHADFTTNFRLATDEKLFPYSTTRDFLVTIPEGLIGNPNAFPKCTPLQFGTTPDESECPVGSQIGSTDIEVQSGANFVDEPIYNITLAGGRSAARFGFYAGATPVILNARLDPKTHRIVAGAEGLLAAAGVISGSTTFWGVPAAHEHDQERITPNEAFRGNAPPGGRESGLPLVPFMTNPSACGKESSVTLLARSYRLPEAPSVLTVPFPALTGCGSVEFGPETALELTTAQTTTGSGLNYELSFPTKGFEVGNLLAGSYLNRAEVALPEGVTVNPSEAEGLGVCSESEFERESFDTPANGGCPETSKIGSVSATSPALDKQAEGAIYLAKPYDNPFGSLLALYLTIKVPDRGVFVGIPGRVSVDPISGQITTLFENLPQLPIANVRLHFREGARAPLVTPRACGTYEAVSNLSPWSAPASTVRGVNLLAIESGAEHGPCPSGGLPPFKPGLSAGSVNNAAGSYSPFIARISRGDSEQEVTHFSMKLPPGLEAKLAGIPYCSDLSIAAAAARTGPHGGEEELDLPSCPAASQIGTTLVGAGVGQVLTYVPGKVYLAGPYHGAPISAVAITAAKAGPFDLGTVVVREALRVNPETAEVFIDATGSDPIPHIIRGIPVDLRDIRVYVDRPEFALNPTNCTPSSVASTLLGAGLDFTSEGDDNPVTVSTRFQAADCAALGFKPKLQLILKGGTKRNKLPAFKAVLNARPGDANISKTEVILPHSEFLEQAHIITVCTRAQFSGGAGNGAGCPAGSIYGRARATTPLLDEPLEGPVFLRSNGGERKLPDLVAALQGKQINVDLVGYIDSVTEKTGKGESISRIRNRFETVPDAPVTRFVLEMRGGKKGLLVNSTDLCKSKHRAEANFQAQNGRKLDFRPLIKPQCSKKKVHNR